MKILIPLFSPPTGTWGSLTRVLAVGSAARARGHEVAFCAAGYLANRLEALGYPLYRMPETTMLGLPKPLSDAFSARSQDMTPPIPPGRSIGSIWFVLFLTGLARYGYLSRLVKAQLAAVDGMKPDILFTEIDPGAFIISRIRSIPIACTYASVMKTGIGDFAWRALKSAGARVLQDYGKRAAEPQEMILDTRTLKIIPSIPELEREIPDARDFTFTGSLFHSLRADSEQAFRPEEGKRYVFVYMGTGSIRLSKVYQVLPRVFPEGSQTMCLVGSQSVAEEKRIGNVVFRPFWDAEGLMPHCDWVFCHGGHNTIIQSLANKAPLIIFPGPIFERRFNAERIQAAGAGRFGELPDFNEAWLANAMQNRTACAESAARLGEKVRSLGGAGRAVELMEGWSGRGGPAK
jgi:UDP:flavonoid glycosyltransferase YjiC (YdhE family)